MSVPPAYGKRDKVGPPRAIAVRFPTGALDVGWGRTLREAALYAFKARAQPWCVKPERREMAELRARLERPTIFTGAHSEWRPR